MKKMLSTLATAVTMTVLAGGAHAAARLNARTSLLGSLWISFVARIFSCVHVMALFWLSLRHV